MNYILDASVALCWVIRRPWTPKALRLRDDYRQSVHRLLAPSIFPAEAASALTKSERQKFIPAYVGHIDRGESGVTQTVSVTADPASVGR